MIAYLSVNTNVVQRTERFFHFMHSKWISRGESLAPSVEYLSPQNNIQPLLRSLIGGILDWQIPIREPLHFVKISISLGT